VAREPQVLPLVIRGLSLKLHQLKRKTTKLSTSDIVQHRRTHLMSVGAILRSQIIDRNGEKGDMSDNRRSAASVLAYAMKEADRLEKRYGFDPSKPNLMDYHHKKHPDKFIEWDTLNTLLAHFNRSTWNTEDPVMKDAERIAFGSHD
jgi:hypothetical protein